MKWRHAAGNFRPPGLEKCVKLDPDQDIINIVIIMVIELVKSPHACGIMSPMRERRLPSASTTGAATPLKSLTRVK